MEDKVNAGDYIKMLHDRITSLENMVNEIGVDVKTTRKARFRAKTQSVSLNSMSKALCVETMDPLSEGRVRFYHPVLHEPDTPVKSLPFAKPISAMGGFDDCGLIWVPPAGSTIAILFENGNRSQPYYMGTTWHRDRGPNGTKLGFPVPEFDQISRGHRKGYLVGSNDESQVLPQWSSESNNISDFGSTREFSSATEEQKRQTFPFIFGMKTQEKNMLKFVDGNAKCNRKGKRIEMLSGCGGAFLIKDDHLHDCGSLGPPVTGRSDLGPCSEHKGDKPYFTDPLGKPIEGEAKCGTSCDGDGKVSCGKVIGGHPATAGNTKYKQGQKAANKNFRHQNEARPFIGPRTPQNNKYDLPQSGMQMLSISGHSIVLDDSVEEPRGNPIWERSLEPFDFGCNDKFVGRMYFKSATGHSLTFSDIEAETGLRGEDNYVELRSALGSYIQLNDHTVGEGGCKPCPPNIAGEKRGVHIGSTSHPGFHMVDNMNEQCGECRKEGGQMISKATQAYIQIQSGAGSEIRLSDDNSQEKTQRQWIQITQPQCINPETDDACNEERGPHFLRFQARPKGEPGIILLRAGGHAVRSTYDMDIVLVGDKEKNPSDKFTYVSKMRISATEDIDFRYSGESHIFFAEQFIFLMAGRDCPPSEGKKCCGPCLFPVIVGRCPRICPYTGWVHFTERSMSERVFASAKNMTNCSGSAPPTIKPCPPGGEAFPCHEDEEE